MKLKEQTLGQENENMKNKISELMKEINIIKEENEKLKKEKETEKQENGNINDNNIKTE